MKIPPSKLMKLKTLLLLVLASILMCGNSTAQEFIEDVNFVRLDKPLAVQTGEKIEVLEIFWYRCPHCYRLEPYLNRWQKNLPEYIEYIRLPAVLTKSWEFDARVFYTFDALGLTDVLHDAYFDAIHKERRSLLTEDQVAKWASEFDIDQQLFIDTFLNSFYVNSKVEAANKLTRAYKTDGVPTIVVDGKFRTKVSLAGGHDELIDLINYLASLAEKERSN
tara:strand:+ start:666 stop:1328 length:663 start_codon:yes stop_codon:yes gene_type:complete